MLFHACTLLLVPLISESPIYKVDNLFYHPVAITRIKKKCYNIMKSKSLLKVK